MEFYNDDLKRRYIEVARERNSFAGQVCEPIFISIKPMEEKLNKDASNFTIAEIIEYFKGLYSASLETLMYKASQLRLYTAFCLQESLVKDSQNHYDELTTEILKTCLNSAILMQKILTAEDIDKIIDSLDNVSDKFLLLAMFEGICGTQMSDLTTLNIKDFNGNIVKLASGKEVKISDRLVQLAKQSTNEYAYTRYIVNSKGEYIENIIEFAEDDTNILKRNQRTPYTEDNRRLRKRLYCRLQYIRDYTGSPAITNKALLESGRINAIKNNTDGSDQQVINYISSKEMVDKYGEVQNTKRYILKYSTLIKSE